MRYSNEEITIQSFVRELVEKGDLASLDVLFTLALHQTGSSGYTHHTEKFERIIGKLAEHSLIVKHGLNTKGYKEKINILNRLHEQCNVNYDNFGTLESVLIGEMEDVLRNDIKIRIKDSEEIEKEVLAFILYYLPIKAEESRILALESGEEGFKYIFGFSVGMDDKNNITCYKLSDFGKKKSFPSKLTAIFNRLFDRSLSQGQMMRNSSKRLASIDGKFIEYEELYFWKIGDILVKMGIAYWVPWITGSAGVHLYLVIPKFMYDIAEEYKHLLPEMTDLEDEIKEIEKLVTTGHFFI